MKQLVIIIFSVLVTEVITKSFNTKVDRLKLFLLENGNLLENENLRGHTQPITGKTLSTIFDIKLNPSTLQQTQRQLQNKLIDNFYLTPTNDESRGRDTNAEDINEILMENYQKYNQNLQLKHMYYPDYLRRIPTVKEMKPLNYDDKNDEFNDGILLYRKRSPDFQKLKYNPLRPVIQKKLNDKTNSRQTKFIPSVSVGALANLGKFFENLKSNVDFIEKTGFTGNQRQILDGDHPIKSLRRELDSHTSYIEQPHNEDFLHAVRNYRPSQRVRALVSMTPEGYHGSNFIDPNYMWLGLGK